MEWLGCLLLAATGSERGRVTRPGALAEVGADTWHGMIGHRRGSRSAVEEGLTWGVIDLFAGGAEDEEEDEDDLMPWAEGLLPAHLKAREDVVQQGRITFARRNGAATAEASITCRWFGVCPC